MPRGRPDNRMQLTRRERHSWNRVLRWRRAAHPFGTLCGPVARRTRQASASLCQTTLPELTYHLEQAGFSGIETYGSWDARGAERIDGNRLILSDMSPD